MQVSALIKGKNAVTISPGASFNDLVNSLRDHQVGALVVSSDGSAVEGMISERDIVRALPGRVDEMSGLTVADLMTAEVVTCTMETTVEALMQLMTEMRIRHVPVVNADGALISIVSIGDVVKSHVGTLDAERTALRDYINS